MVVEIAEKDILDSFDQGKSLLLSRKDFSKLKTHHLIKLDNTSYEVKKIVISKNRILVTVG